MTSTYAPPRAHDVWAGSPLIAGDWRDLHLAEALPLLLRASTHPGNETPADLFIHFRPGRVRAMRPSFYPGWLLVEVQVSLPNGAIGLCTLLYGDAGPIFNDGTSPPLHALNATGALKLETPEAVADYLRYFCSAVLGKEGRFMVVERADEAFGRGRPEPGATLSPDVRKHIAPIVIQKEGDQYVCRAVVLYGRQFFHVKLSVAPAGKVEMSEDVSLGEAAITPELFVQPFWIFPCPPAADDAGKETK
jgi:hypothetical protein